VNVGSVYPFQYDGVQWEPLGEKLFSSDQIIGERFGNSLSLYGDKAVIGATELPPNSSDWGPGKATVFGFNGVEWIEEMVLRPSDGNDGSQFGVAVAINGQNVLAGESFRSLNPNQVYVFNLMIDPPQCPADLNTDGLVGPVDLAILLTAWGPNPRNPADINGDDVVDGIDLAYLLAAWGPCE